MSRADKQKFAAFDIDGTVIRTALFLQVVDELISGGQLAADYRELLDTHWRDYQARRHHDAFRKYNEASVKILFENLHGLPVSDYQTAVNAVVRRSSDQLYVYTRDLIKSLKSQGYFLIALSGSEQYALETFCNRLGFDIVAGDQYHHRNGAFTGEITGVFGDKGVALQAIIKRHGLEIAASIAVGDSLGDAKMLDIVERPIAFNPERQLLETAQARGWEIVIERKNVVYQLTRASDGRYLLA